MIGSQKVDNGTIGMIYLLDKEKYNATAFSGMNFSTVREAYWIGI
jgi:hypothetical protein